MVQSKKPTFNKKKKTFTKVTHRLFIRKLLWGWLTIKSAIFKKSVLCVLGLFNKVFLLSLLFS